MIIIDTELCDGCGVCAAACPNDCIGLVFVSEDPADNDEVAYIDDQYDCDGCGVCVSVCPNEAIELVAK